MESPKITVEEYLKDLKFLSAKGNSNAQYKLGCFYLGVTQDYLKAKEYWEQAASKGHSGAQINLGYLYDYGRGVTQDYSKAKEYYEQAASQGHSGAQYELGHLYHHGFGVTQDYLKAKEYYEQAESQGHSGAQYELVGLNRALKRKYVSTDIPPEKKKRRSPRFQ